MDPDAGGARHPPAPPHDGRRRISSDDEDMAVTRRSRAQYIGLDSGFAGMTASFQHKSSVVKDILARRRASTHARRHHNVCVFQDALDEMVLLQRQGSLFEILA